MIIGVDFDGTCVAHEFPKIGRDIGAIPVLKELVDNGHQLILFTMRSNIENPEVKEVDSDHLKSEVPSGNYLDDAVNWFKDNDIPLYGVQVNPTQHTWTTSPKAYCQLYIDDAALGCPLSFDTEIKGRPYVDWILTRLILRQKGLVN